MTERMIQIDKRISAATSQRIARHVAELVQRIPRAKVYYVGTFGDPFVVEFVADVHRPSGTTRHIRQTFRINRDEYETNGRLAGEILDQWIERINGEIDRAADQTNLF